MRSKLRTALKGFARRSTPRICPARSRRSTRPCRLLTRWRPRASSTAIRLAATSHVAIGQGERLESTPTLRAHFDNQPLQEYPGVASGRLQRDVGPEQRVHRRPQSRPRYFPRQSGSAPESSQQRRRYRTRVPALSGLLARHFAGSRSQCPSRPVPRVPPTLTVERHLP